MCIVYGVNCLQLTTLRGSILEDCIPSASKLSSARGLSPKDILDYVVPGLNVSCLRYAVAGEKTTDQLLRVDEQTVSQSAMKLYRMINNSCVVISCLLHSSIVLRQLNVS